MKIIEAIIALKIPTLALIGVFFFVGFELIKGSSFSSPECIAGAVLLCFGAILGIIMFVDYRYKEQSDHIMNQQSKAIDTLSKALKNTSNTHSKIEKDIQSGIGNPKEIIGKEGGRQYSVGEETETLTN